jgi:2-dehydro-3-deoxygluconokinase
MKLIEDAAWDLIALGEVMLRLDPGERRIHTAPSFEVWEGGGEYNVARGLSRCFRLKTALLSSLPDNAVGRLVENMILQGGVDASHVTWVPFDGIGRDSRVGLNFTERGFGSRAAKGVSDRANSAASQLKPGDLDLTQVFRQEKTRWFHTGGIFAGLSATTSAVVSEAMGEARAAGTMVSYDLNYRPSLWKSIGGPQAAQRINREIVKQVDVLIGNEEDFTAALGFEVSGVDESYSSLDPDSFAKMAGQVQDAFPNLKAIATTLRVATNASENQWGAMLVMDGQVYAAKTRRELILDRVGGGDSFASGLIFGFLTGQDPQWCVDCGCAHGALAMTTPGDVSMATKEEVLSAMKMGSARIER